MSVRHKKAPKLGLLAEAVRFELTDGFPSPVFKTGAIDHSATLPVAPILAGPQQAPGFYEFDHLG